MNKCPCINCITFPICKTQVFDYINKTKNDTYNRSGLFGAYAYMLKPKCTIINKWGSEYLTVTKELHNKNVYAKAIKDFFIQYDQLY